MSEANEGRRRAMEDCSLQTEKYPRDLLQRFMCSNTQQSQFAAPNEDEDSEGIELNLGLSLGGRFGVDKNSKKLIRASSIAGTIPLFRDDESTTPPEATYPSLMRTSSLPTETEEEWRKRKELQTLRRMEAKRRRSEKQRNREGSGGGGGGGSGVGFLEEERHEIEGLAELNLKEKKRYAAAIAGNELGSKMVPPFGLPTWAAAAKQALLGGVVDVTGKGKGGVLGGCGGLEGLGRPASQGSAESQGGSSSGMSELESKPLQGSGSYGEAKSSSSNQMSQERGNQEVAVVGLSGVKTSENPSRTSGEETENPSKKPEDAENKGRETGMNSLEDMPCVFTVGTGPNGKRVEGILYKYGKGEEVRIMCVCHGSFLSPAEFVKHAGGGDVAHPLRHIVVNPNSSPFL